MLPASTPDWTLVPVLCGAQCPPSASSCISASVFTTVSGTPSSVWSLMRRSLGLSSCLHSSWARPHPGRGLSRVTSGAALICSPRTQNAEAGGSGIKSDLDYVAILILIQVRGHWLCLKNKQRNTKIKMSKKTVSIVSSVVGSFFSGEDGHARLLDPAHASVHGWLIRLKSSPPAPILYSLRLFQKN